MTTKQITDLPTATQANPQDLLLKRDDTANADQQLSIQTFIDEALGSAATETSAVTATPDTLAKRDALGRVQSQAGGSGVAAVVHNDTSQSADADTVVKRNSAGRVVTQSGGSGQEAVAHNDADSEAAPNTVAKRDIDGRMKAADPDEESDVATKGFVLPGAPGQLLEKNGYTTLPGGLIIQWVSEIVVVGTDVGDNITVTIDLPTSDFSVFLQAGCFQGPRGTENESTEMTYSVRAITATQISLEADRRSGSNASLTEEVELVGFVLCKA